MWVFDHWLSTNHFCYGRDIRINNLRKANAIVVNDNWYLNRDDFSNTSLKISIFVNPLIWSVLIECCYKDVYDLADLACLVSSSTLKIFIEYNDIKYKLKITIV